MWPDSGFHPNPLKLRAAALEDNTVYVEENVSKRRGGKGILEKWRRAALNQHCSRAGEEEGKKLLITQTFQIPHFHGKCELISMPWLCDP